MRSYGWALIYGTAFGKRAFKEVIELNLGPFGALIQYTYHPYKKREGQQGCKHTEERPCEDTEREREPSGQTKPAQHPDLELPTS